MRDCPACSGSFVIFAQFPKHEIYRCSKCGLGTTTNIGKQTGDYHRDEVYIGSESRFVNIFKRRVKLIKQYSKQPGRVLNIGSSTGLMLSLFQKEGWDIQGIEMSKKAASFAIDRGVPTIVGTFEQAKVADNSFDVVIMNHTLEHLEDPEKVIEKISKILKPAGLLLIDVPNFGSLSAQIKKKDWPYLLPDEHIWHFTAPALKHFLNKEGLSVVSVTNPSGIWDYSSPIMELVQAGCGFKKRFITEILTMIPDYFISVLKMGTSLTVVAQKKK